MTSGILFTANPPDLRAVKADPDDDKFITCAVALKAEAIITGDKALRAIQSYGNTRIETSSEFWNSTKARVGDVSGKITANRQVLI